MPIDYTLDHLIVAVRDLAPAMATYRKLLGRDASWRGRHPTYGTENALYRLDNTYVELLTAGDDARHPIAQHLRRRLDERGEGPFGIALGVTAIDAAVESLRGRGLEVADAAEGSGDDLTTAAVRRWRNTILPLAAGRGVFVLLIEHLSPSGALPMRPPDDPPAACPHAIDHAVVLAGDLEASKSLWVDKLQTDLRAQREFPERGVAIAFIKLGDARLELVGRVGDAGAGHEFDRFWGIAYRVGDIERARERLVAAGFEASPVRTGAEAGTSVLTVKAPATHGVETLFIQRGDA